jgi:hypothetical protein
MRILRRHPLGTDANETAIYTAERAGGGRATAVVSAVALLFSAYSLWETSLKQAQLTTYVTDAVTYTRDHLNEDKASQAGGYEVLAVPVTIANGGARDGAVVSMRLDAKDPETGKTARFHAAYTVDAGYFAGATSSAARPKTPFAALAIAGRSSWTGTVLFYSADYKQEKLVAPKARIDAMLHLVTAAPSSWIDRALGGSTQPVTFSLEMPDIWELRLGFNTLTRMRSADMQR